MNGIKNKHNNKRNYSSCNSLVIKSLKYDIIDSYNLIFQHKQSLKEDIHQ